MLWSYYCTRNPSELVKGPNTRKRRLRAAFSFRRWNGAAGEGYNTRMGLKDGENLNVTCPCCQAKLVVDPIFGAVLSHEAHVKPGPDVDLTQAQSILEQQKKNREDKFADSWFQETNKEDILAKKFEEAMKKAKDAPAGKPIRDFDLD